MTTPLSYPFGRRSLLALAAVGGIASLVGCSAPTSDGPGASSSADVKKLLPTYKQADYLPPPNYPGDPTGYIIPAYDKYPEKTVVTVPTPPGKGSAFTVTTLTFAQPEDNKGPAKLYLNEKLGATLQWEAIPASDYSAKVTTLLAGGKNVPTLLTVPSWDPPARLEEAQSRYYRDLSEFLSGDKILDYPNLAAITSDVWRSCVWNGGLGAIPVPSDPLGWNTYYRADLLERAGASVPTSQAEFTAAVKAATDKGKGIYGLGPTFGVFNRMYGLGLGWDYIDGKPTSIYETDTYADCLAYETSLWKAGYVHPDVVAGTANGQALMAAGKCVVYDDGSQNYISFNSPGGVEGLQEGAKVSALVPFAVDGGPTKVQRNDGATFQLFFGKELSDDQVKEMLGVVNYLAAGFGSAEYEVFSFGVEGKDFTWKDGVPTMTEFGRKDIYSNVAYTATAPFVLALYDNDEFLKELHGYMEKLLPMAVANPLTALWNPLPTEVKKAEQNLKDLSEDIKRGRKSMEDWKSAASNYKAKEAEAGRAFYSKLLEVNPPL